MAELRYNGAFIERFQGPNANKEAKDYVAKRKEKGWTVENDRPIKLLSNGNLVDTFNSTTDAEKARDALLASFSKTDKSNLPKILGDIPNYVIE